jgi:hypothetical protein
MTHAMRNAANTTNEKHARCTQGNSQSRKCSAAGRRLDACKLQAILLCVCITAAPLWVTATAPKAGSTPVQLMQYRQTIARLRSQGYALVCHVRGCARCVPTSSPPQSVWLYMFVHRRSSAQCVTWRHTQRKRQTSALCWMSGDADGHAPAPRRSRRCRCGCSSSACVPDQRLERPSSCVVAHRLDHLVSGRAVSRQSAPGCMADNSALSEVWSTRCCRRVG